MNQPKKSFALAAFFIFCLCLTDLSAQTPPVKSSEPSFDVILQTVVASNDAGKTDVAPSLSVIVKKLKTDFPFSSYRLTSTSIQRVGNQSGFNSRNVSFTPEKNLAIYSTMIIQSLESSVSEQNQETFQVRGFSFEQRIPIVNSIGATDYAALNLTGSFSLAKNTPTVAGSLTTSKADELMFLILTVKSAEK